jgi:hypothetical protein
MRKHLYVKKTFLLLLMAILIAGMSACSTRRMAVREFTGIMADGMEAFEQDDDLIMLEKAFPGNIKLMEALLAGDPDNEKLLVLLARFYAGYTFAFLEEDLENLQLNGDGSVNQTNLETSLRKRVGGYYRKGADYALQALELRHPGCMEKIRRIDTRDACFQSFTKNDVPALFWYGFNLAGYVNNNRDSVRALSKAPLAEKAMQAIVSLEPGYYHGNAHMVLMIHHASRSPEMGGNPELALFHYRNLKNLAGETYLPADLFYARYYLLQKQDSALFKNIMTRIAQSKNIDGKSRLLNKVAVLRAKIYLKAMDKLF